MDFYAFLIVTIVISYLIGSIPFALIIGKVFYNIDLREYGSCNLGTTNVGRVLGKFPAFIELMLDANKGGLTAMLLCLLSKSILVNPDYSLFIFLASGIFACLGHCYPIFASFKGGKSVATLFGLLAYLNYKLFLIFLIVFLVVAFITKIISISSILASTITTLCTFIPFININYPYLNCNLSYLYTTITLAIITLLLIYRHKSNISRLIHHEEKKFSFKKKEK